MKQRATVLFDGACVFCTTVVRALRALDWLGRLDFADANDPAMLAACSIPRERALARMHLVTRKDATPKEGFHAFRWIAGRTPLLWISWPLLWLPGMGKLGQRVYDAIARSRFLLGRCENACRRPDSHPH